MQNTSGLQWAAKSITIGTDSLEVNLHLLRHLSLHLGFIFSLDPRDLGRKVAWVGTLRCNSSVELQSIPIVYHHHPMLTAAVQTVRCHLILLHTVIHTVKSMNIPFFKSFRRLPWSQPFRSFSLRSLLWGGVLGSIMMGGIRPAWAGDPFRTTNPESIGDQTEAAFTALFQEGDYPKASEALRLALEQEPDEPLVYALQASIAFLQEDWQSLRGYGRQTLAKGQNLVATRPVRGYTYVAIGQVLEGAYALSPQGEGSLRGVPTAIDKLKLAYAALKEAKAINPTDPELNLIQGFMELMISLYIPLTKPDQAIAQLENNAAPSYLANWALAIAYRDLDRYEPALTALDTALEGSKNPQLYYLRGQVRIRQGLKNENSSDLIQAQTDFRRALARSSQLPKRLVGQMFREYCRNQSRIDSTDRDCNALQRSIVEGAGEWGPETVPEL